MRYDTMRPLLLALGLVAGLSACPGSDSDGHARSDCPGLIVDYDERMLECGITDHVITMEQAEEECSGDSAYGACVDEMSDLYRCVDGHSCNDLEQYCMGALETLNECLAEEATCPWTDDGECDEPEGTDLCFEGTDVADCT
jgi:hypothetical protein